MPRSCDMSVGILPLLGSSVHVSSLPPVDTSDGPLWHVCWSANQADHSVISSSPVISGLLISARPRPHALVGGGGRSKSLDLLVREIILWCQTLNISLKAVHISGCNNIEVGCLSHLQAANRHHVEPLYRMVSRDSQSPLWFMGHTCGRSVHHQAEKQGRGVLFLPPKLSRLTGQPPAGGFV